MLRCPRKWSAKKSYRSTRSSKVATPVTIPAVVPKPRAQTGDAVARLVVLAFAASILLITAILVRELWVTSDLSRHKFGLGFLSSSLWNPVTEEFGALPFLYGTAVTSLVAMLIAVPLGLGAAIFLSEMAPPRASNVLTFMIELLAAIPSVIYGLLGLFALVPLMREYVEPFLKSVFGFLSGGDPGRDDRPLHHLGIARSAPGGAAGTARGGAGAGRNTVGNNLESGCALRPPGYFGFGFSRLGARIR